MAAPKISRALQIRKNIDTRRVREANVTRITFADIVAPQAPAEPPSMFVERGTSRRARAAALRERMARFARIYNAAYMVRYSQHGAPTRRQEYVMQFVAAMVEELRHCGDFEALIFAVADALTADPSGVPWEG